MTGSTARRQRTYTLVPGASIQRLVTSHHTQRRPCGSAVVGMGEVGPEGEEAPVGAVMVGGAERLTGSRARGEA